LLQQRVRAESFSFLCALTAVVNQLASGRAPLFLQPFLAGGVSIALAKPNRGVRPLCCGDPLRRLVGKCFCIGASPDISEVFRNNNFGVGCPGGVEVVAHSLRNVLEGRVFHDEALLKIDFRNAFNLIDRSAFTRAACEKFPGLSQWTQWCYGTPSILLYDHERVIDSTSGVQQATPWAHYISVVALPASWKKFSNSTLGTINGIWTTGESSVQRTTWSQFGICSSRKARSWVSNSIPPSVNGRG
jgi:hypothetical protein